MSAFPDAEMWSMSTVGWYYVFWTAIADAMGMIHSAWSCFITKILAKEPLKRGSLFSADFSYIITSFLFWRQGAWLSLAGQLQDPSDVQPKKPSITDRYLLVFSFSLQTISHQSFRMFKDLLLFGEILLTCCRLAFFGNYKNKQSSRNEKNNPIQKHLLIFITAAGAVSCGGPSPLKKKISMQIMNENML